MLASLGVGCIALSAIQRSRVMTISSLARDRAHLLNELISLERRERQMLSEHLHDGALQYVLAARQDLDDLGVDGRGTLPRVRDALEESSRLLRSTVTELHPAVLDRVGLPAALDDLVRKVAAPGRRTAQLDVNGWSPQPTSADNLLFSAARELLSNVVKHSHATSVDVTLSRAGACALLVVADDGCGLPAEAARHGLADGHIGLASHALRIEAAGGSLAVGPRTPNGTVVTVELPCRPLPDGTQTRAPRTPRHSRRRRRLIGGHPVPPCHRPFSRSRSNVSRDMVAARRETPGKDRKETALHSDRKGAHHAQAHSRSRLDRGHGSQPHRPGRRCRRRPPRPARPALARPAAAPDRLTPGSPPLATAGGGAGSPPDGPASPNGVIKLPTTSLHQPLEPVAEGAHAGSRHAGSDPVLHRGPDPEQQLLLVPDTPGR